MESVWRNLHWCAERLIADGAICMVLQDFGNSKCVRTQYITGMEKSPPHVHDPFLRVSLYEKSKAIDKHNTSSSDISGSIAEYQALIKREISINKRRVHYWLCEDAASVMTLK